MILYYDQCYLGRRRIYKLRDIRTKLYGKAAVISGIYLFDELEEELLKADASGAFIMLNATVNTGEANSDKSKTGLYFQRSTLDRTDETLLLFRGNAELGRKKI